MTLLAILIAVGIPAVFLFVIYTLDLYASRTFRLVLLCFAWGAIGGLGLSYLFNTKVAIPLIDRFDWSFALLYVAFAPLAEEILKSLSLLYVSRRSEFTYFVDGAIYGFAAGIGFSITENFLYISQNPEMGFALALTRGFSTCLMHGTAAGLVGVAVGRFRFRRRSGRRMALVGGWVVAIGFHALFNGVTTAIPALESSGAVLGVGIGLLGVGLIAAFILLGLREERQWLAETLDREVGVTSAERRAAQAYASIEEVLEPIARQFPDKAKQMEELLLRQAQLGIRRKLQQHVDDPQLQEKLEEEIPRLQAEMEVLRRQVGARAMIYLRSVFPEGALDVWSRLELLAARSGPADLQRWIDTLSPDSGRAPEEGIFGRLRRE